MDRIDLLAAIEAAIYEDPAPGLKLAQLNPVPDSPRYWAIVGNGLRRLRRYDDAAKALRRALALDPQGYECSDIHQKLTDLNVAECRWHDAAANAETAVSVHIEYGPTGFPGPADHGLANALLARGFVQWSRHQNGLDADLHQAHADYRRALALAPDPREAPFVHVAATHNLALLAIDGGTGLLLAYAAVEAAYDRLLALGVSRRSAPALRVQWASTVLKWLTNGQSSELGRQFYRGLFKNLNTIHRRFLKDGAIHDAILVALDLTLLHLEQRSEVDWTAINDLTVDTYKVDWALTPEHAAAFLHWRQAAREEKFPEPALRFVYGRIRGFRPVEPRLHAHGTSWGGAETPTPTSSIYALKYSEQPQV